MRLLYLDCQGGLGGDMFLAALCGLGLGLAPLEDLFRAAGLDVAVHAVPEAANGLAGKRLDLRVPYSPSPGRPVDPADVVARLGVSEAVRAKSLAALRRLAEVRVLSSGHERVHDEVALTALVEVVGVCWGLERLGVESVRASSLPWSRGAVQGARGPVPLPVPAVIALLEGKPVHPTEVEGELVTPVGALLADQLVERFSPGPEGRLLASAVGVGTGAFKNHFNGLRVFLLEIEEVRSPGLVIEKIWVLESNVDHLTGEEIGHFFTALFAAGALDVSFVPAVMKKNRPGGHLQAICAPEALARVRDAFFRNSLALGVRQTLTERAALPREPAVLKTPWGDMAAKRMRLGDDELVRPEFEALAEFSRKTGRTVAELRYLLGEGRGGENEQPPEDVDPSGARRRA